MGSYDSGTFQPVFSVIAKNSSEEKKDEFLHIIKNVLENTVKEGIDEKALRAGINYMEFRFREADYGSFPKGLCMALS